MANSNRMKKYFGRNGRTRLSNFTSSVSVSVRSLLDPSGSSDATGTGSRDRRDSPESGNPASIPSTDRGSSANEGRSNIDTAPSATSAAPAPRRSRRPRGWWPAAELEAMKKKRGEIRLKAMKDLKDETFVVSEGHLEWVFDDDDDVPHGGDSHGDGNGENNLSYMPETLEPQCYLVLPIDNTKKGRCQIISSESTHSDDSCTTDHTHCTHYSHCAGKTSNECAICMLEYDVGDVVVYSKRCGHAFHQECILDWFSREKSQCPSCRAVFWEPKDGKKKKKVETAAVTEEIEAESAETPDEGGSNEETEVENPTNRARSDTEDTELNTPSLRGSTSSGFNDNEDSDLEPNSSTSPRPVSLAPVIEAC